MGALDSDSLHDFLSAAARDGRCVTEREVAEQFSVEVGAVKKRFGLLTGKMVLLQTESGYDCRGVLRCSKSQFDSAGSQGKGNQEYVKGLLNEIDRLNKNNETMRQKLLAAQSKLRELGIDPNSLGA